MTQPVFAIGDVHGHLDRLEALLKQEGLLDRCGARTKKDALVVQVGDLGHFGEGESPTADMLCYRHAYHGWIDVVLWGNHDRYVVDETHAFRGCMRPGLETRHYMDALYREGRYQLAIDAHGFLLTHAGLHSQFKYQSVPDNLKTNLEAFVDWCNDEDERYLESDGWDPQLQAVRDAISRKRGGASSYGGLLWRDITEGLYPGFRQVFGHSASREHIVRYAAKDWFSGKPGAAPENPSYCIDIGGKGDLPGDKCLAGIWLPNEEIVRVDL